MDIFRTCAIAVLLAAVTAFSCTGIFLRRIPKNIFIIVLFFLMGAGRYIAGQEGIRRYFFDISSKGKVCGVISSRVEEEFVSFGRRRVTFNIKVRSASFDGADIKRGAKVRVVWYQDALEDIPLRCGDIVSFDASVKEIKPPCFKGGFDYRDYLRRRGFCAVVDADKKNGVKICGVDGKYRPFRILYGLRKTMRKRLSEGAMNYRTVSFLSGLLFGEKKYMDIGAYNIFRRTGTMHILPTTSRKKHCIALPVDFTC